MNEKKKTQQQQQSKQTRSERESVCVFWRI